jgi:hypothetical protein
VFDSRQRREDFSSSLCVQTDCWAHPFSCTKGTRGPFPGGKALPGRDADHSPHLMPRFRGNKVSTFRCSAYISPKRRYLPMSLQGVTTQKNIVISTAVRTSNLRYISLIFQQKSRTYKLIVHECVLHTLPISLFYWYNHLCLYVC